MAFLTLLASVRPELRFPPRMRGATLTVVLVLAIFRTGAVAFAWMSGQRDIEAVKQSLSHVPAGASVLSLAHYPTPKAIAKAPLGRYLDNSANFWNYPALAVPLRQAYVPNLFTQLGEQPLKVLPPREVLSAQHGPPPPISELYAQSSPSLGYVRYWRACFQYILIMNVDMPDAHPTALPLADLILVTENKFSALYLIKSYSPVNCAAATANPGNSTASS